MDTQFDTHTPHQTISFSVDVYKVLKDQKISGFLGQKTARALRGDSYFSTGNLAVCAVLLEGS